MKKNRLFWGLFFVLSAVLWAQDNSGASGSEAPREGADSIFVPFVSRLQGELKNNLLRLSWIDSPSVRGPVFIYRSNLPFEEISPASRSRPVEVPYGAESYIDEIEGPGTFYYFVVASDEWGQKYEIPIPSGNSIAMQVSVSEEGLAGADPRSLSQAPPPDSGAAVPAQPQPPAGPAAGQGSGPGSAPAPAPAAGQPPSGEAPAIRDLTASVEGDRVILRFSGAEGTRPILYRSVRPFRGTEDLLSAVIVQSGVASPFVDYPVPDIPYYYALIPEADITGGTLRIMPGLNATTKSVEVASGLSLRNQMPGIRSLPLPHISLQAAAPGINAFSETPPRAELSPEAAKVLGGVPSSGGRAEPLKKPRAFKEDLETPAGGEEHILRSVIQGPFSKQEWETARDALIRYLALPRSSLPEARARFYLGQCYYFTGAYRESLFEFLSVQSDYPAEAAEWIQSVLRLLARG